MTAALALCGAFLLAAAVVKVTGTSGAAELDRADQMRRVLPAPVRDPFSDASARALSVAATPAAVPVRPAPKPKPKPKPWKQMPRPTRIVIPAIGVNAPVIKLGRNSDGTAEVPANFADAGWFEPGPEPGELGAAVILGHVDSKSGPGVFYRLPALRRGDRIRVVLANGKTLQFVVTGLMQAAKNRFPTKLVYRKTPRSTLRLVTCGGAFDTSSGHYLDNYIVFAWLVGKP
jgi:sortase (surface protein transpeptidase)